MQPLVAEVTRRVFWRWFAAEDPVHFGCFWPHKTAQREVQQ